MEDWQYMKDEKQALIQVAGQSFLLNATIYEISAGKGYQKEDSTRSMLDVEEGLTAKYLLSYFYDKTVLVLA